MKCKNCGLELTWNNALQRYIHFGAWDRFLKFCDNPQPHNEEQGSSCPLLPQQKLEGEKGDVPVSPLKERRPLNLSASPRNPGSLTKDEELYVKDSLEDLKARLFTVSDSSETTKKMLGKLKTEDVTLCDSCHSMTKTRLGMCGKCHADKPSKTGSLPDWAENYLSDRNKTEKYRLPFLVGHPYTIADMIVYDEGKYYVICPYCGKMTTGKNRNSVKYRFTKHFSKHPYLTKLRKEGK